MWKSRAYNSWASMIQRTTNPNATAWAQYGGRGIAVCDRWRSFAAFYEDMGDPPDGCSIDRVDNAGDYTPDNCRWATTAEQNSNKRPDPKRKMTMDDVNSVRQSQDSVRSLARQYGVNRHTIARIRKNLTYKEYSSVD